MKAIFHFAVRKATASQKHHSVQRNPLLSKGKWCCQVNQFKHEVMSSTVLPIVLLKMVQWVLVMCHCNQKTPKWNNSNQKFSMLCMLGTLKWINSF